MGGLVGGGGGRGDGSVRGRVLSNVVLNSFLQIVCLKKKVFV